MHTSDLMTKRPVVAPVRHVPYRRRVTVRYGANPLPEAAFAAGMASVLTGLVVADPRIGAAAAILWIIR